MPSQNCVIDWLQQRFDAFQPVGNGARCEREAQQAKLFDGSMRWSLKMKLFQQQVNPQASSVRALGQQFRRCRCGDRSLPMAVARPAITLAANHAPIDSGFDLDLLTIVARAQIRQRFTTALTEFGNVRQVDQFLANGQMRVVSSLGRLTSRLLATLPLGVRLIVQIMELIRSVARGLFLRFLTELLRLQLADLGVRLIQLLLQLLVSLYRPSMHALPVADFTA